MWSGRGALPRANKVPKGHQSDYLLVTDKSESTASSLTGAVSVGFGHPMNLSSCVE